MLLQCSGLMVGDLSVPSFTVAEGEVVGLALEAECGDSWFDLLRILSGTVAHPAVSVASNAKAITPWGESRRLSAPVGRVYDLVLTEGVPADRLT